MHLVHLVLQILLSIILNELAQLFTEYVHNLGVLLGLPNPVLYLFTLYRQNLVRLNLN